MIDNLLVTKTIRMKIFIIFKNIMMEFGINNSEILFQKNKEHLIKSKINNFKL